MADGEKVDPDLMGPTGFKPGFHQRIVAQALEDYEVSHGIAGCHAPHCHGFPAHWIPPDGRLDGAALHRECPVHQGEIAPVHEPSSHQSREPAVNLNRLRHHEQSGGVLVQAVDHSRTKLLAACGAMPHQGVDKRARCVASGGMDRHAGGFAHDHEPLVFEEDGDGQDLRQDIGPLLRGDHYHHGLPLGERIALRTSDAVHRHSSRSDECGDVRTTA